MLVRTERDGRVMTVTLDNPPRQFQSRTMTFELFELLEELERDRSIGAVVITGAHPRSFLTHYMAAIRPFRHLIVYPPLMRQIGREWRARADAAP
jgi:hypothetical protein